MRGYCDQRDSVKESFGRGRVGRVQVSGFRKKCAFFVVSALSSLFPFVVFFIRCHSLCLETGKKEFKQATNTAEEIIRILI